MIGLFEIRGRDDLRKRWIPCSPCTERGDHRALIPFQAEKDGGPNAGKVSRDDGCPHPSVSLRGAFLGALGLWP